MQNPLWNLAVVFLPLSIVTIGGGQSAVAEIHRQVVDLHHWLTPNQFVDAFAISRMTPGPGSLLVTLIGWQVAGFWGAVVATLAIFGPTAFLIYGVAHVWSRYRGARWQVALETGLRPVAAGMIVASTYVLMRSMDGGWQALLICLTAAVGLTMTRINAVMVLLLGALGFVGLTMLA
ncbi:chromate transporter [Neorhizobium sp. P12A]|jgi:chromate transporter|uniref:chromate transporter n=1 Tax=Neorhizobium sp. P12A TaxID=2268027 RepID=UPI0011EED1FD|nr:chromate transporter [Neorhizobium sp. P12A]KAA0697252.1 chromate transporter [Neorhizobium sp. P12A]